MRIGIVTDEISADIKEALSIGVDWEIKDYELRCIGSNRVPYITKEDIGIINDHREKSGIKITALSPGAFKCALSDTAAIRKNLSETLPKTFELAKKLDCSKVIIFGFKKDSSQKDNPSEYLNRFTVVLKILTEASLTAQESGINLLLENEPGFWCDTGMNTANIIETVDAPNLKANWDPSNAACSGEKPYPEGYEHIKKFIAGIHVKDTMGNPLKECVPVGEGIIDWLGQLKAIVNDGMIDHVTIETHSLPLIEKSQKNLERVRKILGI